MSPQISLFRDIRELDGTSDEQLPGLEFGTGIITAPVPFEEARNFIIGADALWFGADSSFLVDGRLLPSLFEQLPQLAGACGFEIRHGRFLKAGKAADPAHPIFVPAAELLLETFAVAELLALYTRHDRGPRLAFRIAGGSDRTRLARFLGTRIYDFVVSYYRTRPGICLALDTEGVLQDRIGYVRTRRHRPAG